MPRKKQRTPVRSKKVLTKSIRPRPYPPRRPLNKTVGMKKPARRLSLPKRAQVYPIRRLLPVAERVVRKQQRHQSLKRKVGEKPKRHLPHLARARARRKVMATNPTQHRRLKRTQVAKVLGISQPQPPPMKM
jgi:hypothetical protein